MTPLISVIIPVYKVEKYLNKCVESVVNQTYQNLDIILVDDGSPDSCPRMCEDWAKRDSRIRVIHKTNAGLGEARNSGMEIAMGEYVMFVDSDDWLSLDAVQVLYERMMQDGSDMVVGQNIFSYENGKEEVLYSDWMYDTVLTGEDIAKKMGCEQKLPYYAWGKLYRYDMIKNIKFPATRCSEDLYFMVLLVDVCQKVSLVSRVIYHYLQRSGSIMHNKSDIVIKDNVKVLLFAAKHYLNKGMHEQASYFFTMAAFRAVEVKKKRIVRPLFLNDFTHKQRAQLLEKNIRMKWRYLCLYMPFIYNIVKIFKGILRG